MISIEASLANTSCMNQWHHTGNAKVEISNLLANKK